MLFILINGSTEVKKLHFQLLFKPPKDGYFAIRRIVNNCNYINENYPLK